MKSSLVSFKKSASVLVLAGFCLLAVASYADIVFDPGNNITQIVSEVVSGMSNVVVNPSSSGGGVVFFNARNTYLGSTFLGSGTLCVSSMADGGWPCSLGVASSDPANLVLGNGTLRYSGAPVVTDRGHTIRVAPEKANYATVLQADGDITFTGDVYAERGNFIKSGSGTVTYAGSGSHQMSRGQSSGLGQVINFKANGDSPTVGYSGFNITAGRVVLGAHPDQITHFTSELVVGTRTTTAAGMETPAYLDFVGGTHHLGSYLAIGRANGTTTTAPESLSSRVTIYDGSVKVGSLSMGYSANVSGYNASPYLDVFGGALEITGNMRVGDHAGGHPTVNLYGGATKAYDLTAGIYGATDANINLFSNAVLEIIRNCNLANAAGTLSRLSLHGGRLRTSNVYENNPAGNGTLYLNGGVFEVRSTSDRGIGATVEALVSTNGAIFDTLSHTLVIHTGLEHDPTLGATADGGLHKSGSGTLELAGANTYTGPTVISNGTLRLTGTLPHSSNIVVRNGATLSVTNNPGTSRQVDVLKLGVGSHPAPAAMEFAVSGGACASLEAAGLEVNGNIGVRLVEAGTTNAVAANGTFNLLSYPASSALEAAMVIFANPAPGKLYTFSVTDAGAGRDQLRVTISNAPATASTWIDAAGGSWSEFDNWSPAAIPDAPGKTVLFTTPAQSGGASVTLPGNATIGSLLFNSSEAYTIEGDGTLISDSGNATTAWIVEEGSHTATTDLTLKSGITIETVSGTAQTIAGDISGTGGVSVNPAATGGGGVTLSGDNTYVGGTTLGCGTLTVNSLADGGQPSAIGASAAHPQNLVLGAGTLRYIGPPTTAERGLTIDAGNHRAAIFETQNDVTLGGAARSVSGAFIKSGAGCLSLTGIATHVLGCDQGDMWHFDDWPENGDSPEFGFPTFAIANGKMVWGGEGQRVTALNGEAWIGICTTTQAGQETTGELEIVGGYTRFGNFLVVGRDNGNTNTAPVPMQPKLTLTDGTLSIDKLIISYGNHAGHNTHGVIEIHGGTLEVDSEFRLGDQSGCAESPAHATLNMYGGTLSHQHASEGITMGWRGSTACDGTLNMHGGLIDEAADIKMGGGNSTSHVNLHGGTLRAQNISGGDGDEYLYLNGVVYQPRGGGQSLSELTEVLISTNGVTFDTSYIASDTTYSIDQALRHDPALGGSPDGGLIKSGSGCLIIRPQDHTFTGAVRLREGVLGIQRNALQNKTIVAAAGTGIRLSDSATAATVADLTLGTNGTGVVEIDLSWNNGNTAPIRVTGDLVVDADIELHCHLDGRMPRTLPTGVYTVLVYRKSQPAPSLARFRTSAQFTEKSGVFEIVAVDDEYDAVVMTVTVADTYDGSAWNIPGDGAWEIDTNWSTPPANQSGTAVLFTNAIPASGAAITASGNKTAGMMIFDADNSFTIAGGTITLNNQSEAPNVSVISGKHNLNSDLELASQPNINTYSDTELTVAGEISGSAGIKVNQFPEGGGIVNLSTDNTFSGAVSSGCGTLRVTSLADGGKRSSIGASTADKDNLTWGAGTLKYDGPSTVTDRGFKTTAVPGRASILHTDSAITFGGEIQCASGAFIKRGAGTLTYTGLGDFILGKHNGNGWSFEEHPENGDSPSVGFNSLVIADGKMVWGRSGQNMKICGEAWIGTRTTFKPGAETTGELEIRGGYTRFDSFLCLGRNNGDPTTAPTPLKPRLDIYGGTLSVCNFIIGYDSHNKHYTRPVLNLYEGVFSVDNDFRMGNNRGHAATPTVVTVNIHGGLLRHTHASYGIRFGATSSAPNGIFNIFGGEVDEAALVQMGLNNTTSHLNLHGGVLKAQNITAGTGEEHIFFNGGVFRPTASEAALANAFSSAIVSTNGAIFDTSLAGDGGYSVEQPLSHDASLNENPDGGLLKIGAGTLTLATENGFTGPVVIEEGTLKATVNKAVPTDLRVNSEAVFDAGAITHTLQDVYGEGRVENGTAHIIGSVTPGANENSAAGALLTFDNLTLAKNATIVCTTTASGQPTGSNDILAIEGHLNLEGGVYIDFGRSAEEPLDYPYTATIMTYGDSEGAFTGWRALNTGYPDGSTCMRVIRDESGSTKAVRIEMVRGGTLLILR